MEDKKMTSEIMNMFYMVKQYTLPYLLGDTNVYVCIFSQLFWN